MKATKDFVDSLQLKIIAGKGGRGGLAFRREPYVPQGGPNGGNGGNGGSVYFEGSADLHTLLDMGRNRIIRAVNGDPGRNKNQNGHRGADLIVKIPLGTAIYNDKTNSLIADIVRPGQRVLIAKGGRGGKGNKHFVNSRNRATSLFEEGLPGQNIMVRCELKILADVGLVGLPNAGKSTLLAAISNRQPEIGSYPFTTLTPQLGTVQLTPTRSFVVADLPGLIEGAHAGKGLGHQFLKHTERCRAIIYLIDGTKDIMGEEPLTDWKVLHQELAIFNPKLVNLPTILAINKIDLLDDLTIIGRIKQTAPNLDVLAVSGLKRMNLKKLKQKMWYLIQQTQQSVSEMAAVAHQNFRLYTLDEEIDHLEITEITPHSWKVTSSKVNSLFERYPLLTRDNWLHVQKQLTKIGFFQKLVNVGVTEKDEIIISPKLKFIWMNGKLT